MSAGQDLLYGLTRMLGLWAKLCIGSLMVLPLAPDSALGIITDDSAVSWPGGP